MAIAILALLAGSATALTIQSGHASSAQMEGSSAPMEKYKETVKAVRKHYKLGKLHKMRQMAEEAPATELALKPGKIDEPEARTITMYKTQWKTVAAKRALAVKDLRNVSILFMGDSQVEYWMGEQQGKPLGAGLTRPRQKMWKTMIVDRYGPSYASGIGDDKVANLLWRIQNGESPAAAQPRVIMLHIGSNDVKYHWVQAGSRSSPDQVADKIINGYQKLIMELDKASPHSQIVLTAVMPRSPRWGSTSPAPYQELIPKLNKRISELADNSTIHYKDCSQVFLNKNGKIDQVMSTDYIHPSDKGGKAWLECLQPKLDQILKK